MSILLAFLCFKITDLFSLRGSQSKFCTTYHAWCEDSLMPLGLDDQSCEKGISIRGRDRLRNDPQWFPDFLNH